MEWAIGISNFGKRNRHWMTNLGLIGGGSILSTRTFVAVFKFLISLVMQDHYTSFHKPEYSSQMASVHKISFLPWYKKFYESQFPNKNSETLQISFLFSVFETLFGLIKKLHKTPSNLIFYAVSLSCKW